MLRRLSIENNVLALVSKDSDDVTVITIETRADGEVFRTWEE